MGNHHGAVRICGDECRPQSPELRAMGNARRIGVRMEHCLRVVCAVFLSSGLAWPIVAIAQEPEPVKNDTSATGSLPHATQGPEESGGRRPCAEPTDRKAAQARREAALAKLPDNYRYWLTEDARYLISPEERCTFVRLLSDEE
jgi:hypothetical protein